MNKLNYLKKLPIMQKLQQSSKLTNLKKNRVLEDF